MPKEFKRNDSKDSNDKGSSGPKKRKGAKKDQKPSFERYRDEARPSDFGSSAPKRSSSSGYGDNKRKPFGDKPAFRKKYEGNDREERNSDEKKPFNKERTIGSDDKRKPFSDKPAFRKKPEGNDRVERSSDEKRPYKRTEGNEDKRKSFGDKPSFRKKSSDDRGERGGDEKRPFNRERSSETENKRKPFGDKSSFRKKPESRNEREEKPFRKKETGDDFYQSKPSFQRESDKKSFDYEAEYQAKKKGGSTYDDYKKNNPEEKASTERKPGSRDFGSKKPFSSTNYSKPYKKTYEKKGSSKKSSSSPHESANDGTIRLNKYISNAGICSRREADDLIASGVVQVNGKIITEMGYKVKPTDVIKYGGQTLKKERLVYLILNKPKDYITTVDDPEKRRTVLELVAGACRERIYPVGRLDRSTTGLLMFTNDGELTKKLTHPRYGVRKIYHVELDKPLKRADMDAIEAGIELEDGDVKVDEISYVGDGKDKSIVGVEIHSGKNRIVRRIFEHFGYNVRKLDRVMFGPLTKKDMPRGRWRLLTEAEVGMLKMISSKEG